MHNKSNFNFIASYYDLLSLLMYGKSIKKSQLTYMQSIPDNANVLIVGDGTGFFLSNLLQLSKAKSITWIDSSSKMMSIAKNRIKNLDYHTELKMIDKNLEEVELQPSYDVVVTHFFLDLFTELELESTISKLEKSLKENGIWLCADFSSDYKNKFWQKILMKSMIAFFKMTANLNIQTFPNIEHAFRNAGIEKINSTQFYSNFIESRLYQKTKMG